jgi:hypothetical protein
VASILVVLVVSYAELVVMYIQIGFLQFPPVVIVFLFFLVLLSRGIRKATGKPFLSPQELTVVYLMMLISSMISSRGLMEKLIPALVAVNYFANPANNWVDLFFKHIHPWLVPFNPRGGEASPIAVGFYEGLSKGTGIPWKAWVVPFLTWGSFVLVLFFGFLCISVILRRQWIDNEKLSFPLVQLPLEFVKDEEGGFIGNRLLWMGFAVPAVVFALNGLHEIFPFIPGFPISGSINRYMTERPWSDIFFTPVYLSFAAIGFFYFLPSQILLSLWFFFVLSRIQDVIYSALGMRLEGMPLYPTRIYMGYQVAGAYIVLAGYLLYVSIPHIRDVVRKALGSNGGSDEVLSYRVAFFGLIGSMAFSVAWCSFFGLSLWFSFFEMTIYLFVVALIMARSTSEAGLPMTETSFRPIDIYHLFFLKRSLGPRNLTFLSLFDAVFTRDQRGLILTAFLDGQRMAEGVGIRRRDLLTPIVLGIGVSLIASASFQLWLPYRRGALGMYWYAYQGNPLWAFQDNAAAISGVDSPLGAMGISFFVVGIAVTSFLAVMRTLFWWWPFHPLGYALCASWTMIVFWFPVFIAWLLKTPILRYGGIGFYKKLRPFFLGMIFGEFSMAVVWTCVSWIFGTRAPFFPWP